MSATVATACWQALGTTALVRVADERALSIARALLAAELEAIDRAASRFRPDSELERVNAAAGRPIRVSPLLAEAIAVALAVAQRTGGAVDPTIGEAIMLAGYDRDYQQLDRLSYGAAAGRDDRSARCAGVGAVPGALRARRVPGWQLVSLRREPDVVTVPSGVRLDLGATAKALAADRAARAIAQRTDTGVLVALGGDIAVCGPSPPDGWLVHVTDDHRSAPDAPGQTVSITAGGLATSSVTTRRWRHRGKAMHHVIDPANGAPVRGPWRTVSVAARSCVDANAAATAAIVLGKAAREWLSTQQLPSRLVAHDGAITVLCGWPAQS